MSDLVSIIMPTYNCEEYINETIQSVINQTHENWELIIIDDCSKDNTVENINNYLSDKRIVVIHNETNEGAALCRNKGLRKAKGRWIAFLDGDDVWLPQKLEKQINEIECGSTEEMYWNILISQMI